MRAGIAAQDDDAVGQQDGFFDVVGDDEDGRVGIFLPGPELQQFAAQVLGGEHIQRGERLVHEENFGLHHQRAGKADALLHAAGEFLGIGALEAVQADRVEHVQAALAALDGRHAAGLERSLDVFQHGEPGKQREALEDDGDVGASAAMGCPCQKTSPAGGGERPVSMRSSVDLPRAGGTEQARISPG